MYKHRVEIKDDSALIVGHLYIPDGESDRPCVVISHEFGFDQNWETKYALELAKRSYPVFTYDFPGSGNGCSSGRKTTEMSVLTEVGDLKAVVRYLHQRLGDRELVLAGFSMGGMVSALAAAELGDEIRGLILVYPALSIADDARKGKALGARFDPHAVPDTFWTKYPPIKLGRRFAEDAFAVEDWLDRIGKYKGPVLLIHGENDRIVPIIYSEMAASVYDNVKFVRIPHAGHIFWQPWVKNKAIQKMIVFLAELGLHRRKEPHEMTADEFFEILTEVCDELPDDFFRDLHHGVMLSEETRTSPHARADDLLIMGEYHRSNYGNQITIYYGSFRRKYPNADREFIKDRLREVVRHEFRHHMENLGGMHGVDSLEHEDKVWLRTYLRNE